MSMQNNLMQGNSKVNENASQLYMNWKQWVPDEFGSLNSSERKYFKSEIERRLYYIEYNRTNNNNFKTIFTHR